MILGRNAMSSANQSHENKPSARSFIHESKISFQKQMSPSYPKQDERRSVNGCLQDSNGTSRLGDLLVELACEVACREVVANGEERLVIGLWTKNGAWGTLVCSTSNRLGILPGNLREMKPWDIVG